jgi:hypothetical protein
MHISILSPLYCKHYANGPAGTDLAREKSRITVTGITACPIDRLPECAMVGDHVRGITVRWITPIPVDRHVRICYARGFGCLLIGDQHFSCFPYAILRHRMAVCIFSAVFPGFEEYVIVYCISAGYLSLYTVLYISSTPFSILCILYRYNKTRYIVYTGLPFSTTD